MAMDEEDLVELITSIETNSCGSVLDLEKIKIHPHQLQRLIPALAINSSMSEIVFKNYYLDGFKNDDIVSIIALNKNIQSITIKRGLTAKGLIHIAKALNKNTYLRYLKIDDLESSVAESANVFKALAEILTKSAALQTLICCSARLQNGIDVLAAALAKNTTLRYLNLDINRIGTAEAKILAEALAVNTGLHVLSLLHNSIGTAGWAKALEEMLNKNTSLHALDLSGNKISEALIAKVDTTMKTRGEKIAINKIRNQLESFNALSSIDLAKLGKPVYMQAYQELDKLLALHYACLIHYFDPDRKRELEKNWQTFISKCQATLKRFDSFDTPSATSPLKQDVKMLKEVVSSPAPLQETKDTLEQRIEKYQQQLSQHQFEIEKNIRQIIDSTQSGSLEASSKTEQQILDMVLDKLIEQQESLSPRQTTVSSIEDELRNLKVAAAALQAEIDRLNKTEGEDPLVRSRLQALEQQLKPLLKEHEERQRVLQAQQNIYQHTSLKTFYNRMQAKLNQLFLAHMAITSGQIQRNPDKANLVINLLGKSLQIVTLGLSSTLSDGINAFYNTRQMKKITKLTDAFVVSITASEALVERVSRELTLRYEEQIKDTTVPGQETFLHKTGITSGPNGGSETLAECAVVRIIDALSGGKIEKEIPLDLQLVDAVFQDTRKHGLVPLIMNQKIQTISKKAWTDKGVFRHTGIRTDKGWYAGNTDFCHESELYGYRLGTQEEADRLGLVIQKASSSIATVDITVASSRQIQEVTAETKAVKDLQEFQGELLRHEKAQNEQLSRELEQLKKEFEIMKRKQQKLETLVQKLLEANGEITIDALDSDQSQYTPGFDSSKLKSPTSTKKTVASAESRVVFS